MRASTTPSTASAIASTSRRSRSTETGAVTAEASAGRGGRGGGRGGTGIERGRQAASAESPNGDAQGVLPRPQSLGQRRGRRRPRSRSRPTAARRTASSTAPRAGSTARSSPRPARCGGRPTARRSRTTASTRSRCLDYYLQLDQTKIQSTNDVEAYPKSGTSNPDRRPVRLRRRDQGDDQDRRPRRQAVRQRRRRPLRLPRLVVARRPRAAVQPHEPAPERHGVRRRQPVDGRVPRHRPRGMADRLGRQSSADAVPQGQQPLHLGVRAERLGATSTSTISPAS